LNELGHITEWDYMKMREGNATQSTSKLEMKGVEDREAGR
jgi:hypothetical protein